MKNMTTSPIVVTLYDCVAKRDQTPSGSTITPTSAWNDGLSNEQTGLPQNSNGLQANFPGARPYASQKFCQWWTVKRSFNFVLAAGSTHTHYVSVVPGGMFNAELTNNLYFMHGLTTCVMAVIHGTVAQDPGTPFNVGYHAATMDVVAETHYTVKAMEKSRTGYTQFSTLPLAGTSTVVAEDTDVVQTAAAV